MFDAPGPSQASRALFVRRGSFSHVNASLLAALRRQRPDIQFDDLDLGALIPPRSLASLRAIAGTIAEYGLGSVRSRDLLRHRLLRSQAYFGITRRLILAAASRHDYLFTVQTQTLFNAANGRVPNLIYTDNASIEGESSEHYQGLGEPTDGWLRLEAEIYRDAAHVFTFGNRVRRVLIDRYHMPDAKVSLGGTGANVVPATPVSCETARYNRRNILFAGINWERKGGPDLLAAFIKLRERLPDVSLTIVGCTPPEAEGVPGCEIRGRVPMQELETLYRAASCLCVPSRHEPFGNVFVEAGHFGLPVVATRVGEIGDVVHDGVNGFRVPPKSPEALTDALWQVLHDPEIARSMGAAGMRVTANYTWDDVARLMLAKAPLAPLANAG